MWAGDLVCIRAVLLYMPMCVRHVELASLAFSHNSIRYVDVMSSARLLSLCDGFRTHGAHATVLTHAMQEAQQPLWVTLSNIRTVPIIPYGI